MTAAGIAFDDALNGLRPGPAWLRRNSAKALLAVRRESGPFGRSASDVDPIYDYHADWLAPAQAIAVIRPRSSGFAYAGIRVVDQAIEVIATVGDCHISTQGGLAWLTLDRRLPETLKVGCINRRVDELVDSPLFAARGYRIGEAFDVDADWGPRVLSFRTGLSERAMPWPELGPDI